MTPSRKKALRVEMRDLYRTLVHEGLPADDRDREVRVRNALRDALHRAYDAGRYDRQEKP